MKGSPRVGLAVTSLCFVVALITATGCGGSSSSPTQPSVFGGSGAGPTVTPGAQVLIDASKDGGVWWFPQSGPFNPANPHQGKALADVLRGHDYTVDELPRGTAVTDSLLTNYRLVIRVGSCTPYSSAELNAYDRFVARGDATLWLLTDHMNGGCSQSDPLAGRFGGITYAGGESGTITTFSTHAITAGVTHLNYVAGATVVSFDAAKVEIFARMSPSNRGVMGIIKGYAAKVFFLGDSNGVQTVPQPLINNLIAWSFGS